MCQVSWFLGLMYLCQALPPFKDLCPAGVLEGSLGSLEEAVLPAWKYLVPVLSSRGHPRSLFRIAMMGYV